MGRKEARVCEVRCTWLALGKQPQNKQNETMGFSLRQPCCPRAQLTSTQRPAGSNGAEGERAKPQNLPLTQEAASNVLRRTSTVSLPSPGSSDSGSSGNRDCIWGSNWSIRLFTEQEANYVPPKKPRGATPTEPSTHSQVRRAGKSDGRGPRSSRQPPPTHQG